MLRNHYLFDLFCALCSVWIFYVDAHECFFSATTSNLGGMLLGRFLVGVGLGIGPSVASLYITEVN